MSERDANDQLAGVEPSRRRFIAKFAGAVFAAPLISSFALDGIARATPVQLADRHRHSNMPYGGYGNQKHPNMHHHNMHHGNMPYGKNYKHGEGCDDPFWWVYGECFPVDNHHHRKVTWW
jgi:hypothetical protein